jgi:hypothetical protein
MKKVLHCVLFVSIVCLLLRIVSPPLQRPQVRSSE